MNLSRLSQRTQVVLKDEIDCRGISQRQLAHEIGVSSSLLNEVLNGKEP